MGAAASRAESADLFPARRMTMGDSVTPSRSLRYDDCHEDPAAGGSSSGLGIPCRIWTGRSS
jgi:hypothetical protein